LLFWQGKKQRDYRNFLLRAKSPYAHEPYAEFEIRKPALFAHFERTTAKGREVEKAF